MKTQTPLRVIHVAEAPLGGVIAYLEEMLPAQAAMGHDVTVITPEINREALAAAVAAGVRLVTVPVERKSGLSLLRFAHRVLAEVRATAPDILHIHSTVAGALVRSLRPLMPRKTRVVYCAHGWAFLRDASRASNRTMTGVERLLAAFADRIVCISQHERDEAITAGLPRRKLVVIENGVSPGPAVMRAPRAPDAPRIIAFAGRFDRQKGFDTFCDVLRELGTEARGIAIGRAIVSREDAYPPDNLELLGWQPRERVYQLYAEADLLLMPSRWEGFGLVAVEAMQAGLPVFASRVGGLQDIVVEGETGRLFRPGDTAATVKAIRDTSDADLRRYGQAGHARYKAHYTAARMNRQMDALYQSLVAKEPIAKQG